MPSRCFRVSFGLLHNSIRNLPFSFSLNLTIPNTMLERTRARLGLGSSGGSWRAGFGGEDQPRLTFLANFTAGWE